MKIKFKTPAKINLGLHVHGKREDGFHELETIFQMVSLYDDLELELLPSGIKLECDAPGVPVDETNLVYKAVLLLRKHYQDEGKGVSVRLKKNIPFGAGLGGGSGNAAGVLMGLNRLWNLKIEREKLAILAAELGSDVPFFLT
ncbi:MAG: 4-(cytidine 5'-diphospho)-2-C-methyl-D-erythritol kinase, partial [Nitrospinaceae bacterium]|nr:4-(cytidine 5'-diphospho)-2-C-methyl-D-erythritol kinase [Nitrospinaceae bacterium]